MIVFARVEEATILPGVGLQVTARLPAPGPSDPPQPRVEATAFREAAARFAKAAPALHEMFKAPGVGAVDDLAIAADGSLAVTATITDPTVRRKASYAVYRELGVAVRVLARDPDDPDRITKAEIIAVSLVDGADAGFDRLAKGSGSDPSGRDPTMAVLAATERRMLALDAELLDIEARLRPYERPARR